MTKRIQFFVAHFGISLLVAVFVTVLVYFVWYPQPLATGQGIGHLFFMLLIIDAIIGPLLGLLVYKEGKKTLKFDLTVVILLQFCAFIYGFYHIAQGRPAWIVLGDRVFSVVKNSDIEYTAIDQAKPQFQHASYLGPEFAMLRVGTQNTNQNHLLDGIPQNGTAIRYPANYENLSEAKLRLQLNTLPISLLENYNSTEEIEIIQKKYPQANGWLGLSASAKDMVVLINKEKGEVVKIVDLRPWK